MLEGFPSSHPRSWNSVFDHPSAKILEQHPEQNRLNGNLHQHPSGLEESLRGRSSYASTTTNNKADTPSDLFVSLDFLYQAEDDTIEVKSRGRVEFAPDKHRPSLLHRTSQGSSFWDSPELDSSSGSEQEWRRNLASDTDPIHKRVNRSSSREPPGTARLSSSPSRAIDSVPFSRDRSPSVSRPSQRALHLGLWATDTSSPLRQTVDFVEADTNASWPDIGQREYRDSTSINGGKVHQQAPSTTQSTTQASKTPIQASNQPANIMSSSPSQTRNGIASSPPHLATMQEEAWDAHYPFRSNGSIDLRSTVRNRSTSSAAAIQQAEKSMAPRGNSSDTFSRSISLWKGEFGGMSPGTYSSRATFQEDSPTFSSQSQSRSNSQSQWERGRRSEYIGAAFGTFSEEDDVRELGTGGTESRRHSIAADPASTTLIGQRRAIGFEVSRPHPSSTSRTSSVGRPGGNPLSAQANSFSESKLFGGGGLAISEDDLALDLHSLKLDLNNIDGYRHQQQQYHEDRRRINTRIPSSNAAVSGAHAASMPMAFNGQEVSHFGQSPPLTNRMGKWPVSAGFRDDETGTSWSDMISSPGTTSSGFNDNSQGYQPRSDNMQDSFTDDRKTALSATAKAFHGSGSIAFTGSNGGHSQSYAQSVLPSPYLARQPSQERSSDYAPASPSKPFKPFNRQTGQQQAAPAPVLANVNTLSDMAIASLVTLGPLAPASGGPNDGPGSLQELGKGVPLQMLPRSTTLYIVEFKEGRTDLYFRQQQGPQEEVRKGDLVIVEADRGKDLGTVVNDSITVDQVQGFLSHQAELTQGTNNNGTSNGISNQNGDAPHPAAVALSRLTRSINPKRLFSKAGPGDTTLLHSKTQDEERALSLCTTKVNQRGLPMMVVAAELQWDRRKLTFYYTATQRVDFRDLVKELFRLYKTRIWMCHLSHPSGNGTMST